MLLEKVRYYQIVLFLFNLNVSHDEFVSINNVLREYNEMKKEIKNP